MGSTCLEKKCYSNGHLPNHTLKGSFWWRDNLRLLQKFKGLASAIVYKGDTCFLWHDLWGGPTRSQALPQLFSFARQKNITILRAKSTEELAQLFTLPISEEAFQQLLALASDLNDIQDSGADDVWSYIWGSPNFSSVKAYKQLIGSRQVHHDTLGFRKLQLRKNTKFSFGYH
jgi:hypothetical protein